ncbi:tetratricopeptide repeat protein [Streptomyces sp. NPDC051994]
MALHAYANGGAGHLEQAVRLHERILANRQQELGDSHPDTLASRSNLADAYRASGDSQRAASLDQQTLAHCLRELGEDHPLTTLIRHKLAGIHTPWP